MKYLNALTACLAVALGACAPSGPAPISAGDRYRPEGMMAEAYPLGPGDKLRVTIFNEPQLSGEFVVDSLGKLNLPLIGDVAVQGDTVIEASRSVEKLYLDRQFLLAPKATMEVVNYRPFFIVGEVRMPGQYPYVAGLTAWSAVAAAQGLTPRAQKGVVYIRRNGEQHELPYKLSPELRIWPGDVIRFGERFF